MQRVGRWRYRCALLSVPPAPSAGRFLHLHLHRFNVSTTHSHIRVQVYKNVYRVAHAAFNRPFLGTMTVNYTHRKVVGMYDLSVQSNSPKGFIKTSASKPEGVNFESVLGAGLIDVAELVDAVDMLARSPVTTPVWPLDRLAYVA